MSTHKGLGRGGRKRLIAVIRDIAEFKLQYANDQISRVLEAVGDREKFPRLHHIVLTLSEKCLSNRNLWIRSHPQICLIFGSIATAIKSLPNYYYDDCRNEKLFIIRSYEFLAKRPWVWPSIKSYTGHDHKSINEELVALRHENDIEANEFMMSPEIFTENSTSSARVIWHLFEQSTMPTVPESMQLFRCIRSTSEWDVAELDDFSTRRLTSTSTVAGTCVGKIPTTEKVKKIYMDLTLFDVRGIFVSFNDIGVRNENEVLLQPGLTFIRTDEEEKEYYDNYSQKYVERNYDVIRNRDQ
jgi:hypothetical protein